jgi:hypothetical protein
MSFRGLAKASKVKNTKIRNFQERECSKGPRKMQTLKRFQQLITKVFGMTLKPGNDLKHYFWPEFNN